MKRIPNNVVNMMAELITLSPRACNLSINFSRHQHIRRQGARIANAAWEYNGTNTRWSYWSKIMVS